MPNYTILIIDYEPRTIEMLRSTLARIGCRVEVALDGLSAMRAFRQHKPDVTLI
jgi:CheY-like chemotaxis protein